jgi:hypothetical protein
LSQYRIKGVIRPTEDGAWEVDLSASRETPKSGPKSTAKVSAKSDDEVAAEIQAVSHAVGPTLSRLARDMSDMLAASNKSGKVARSKVLREIYVPLASALERGISTEAMQYGLEQAIARDVPNMNYAKKAAAGFTDALPEPTNLNQSTTRYDIITTTGSEGHHE